ncbi:MAG TPA: PhzF family phenazine biosynthesis protein [Bacteroidetes bacterium]|nr:PhzF family phenazine biosynthesis protein [Bacteroidota bacterium]
MKNIIYQVDAFTSEAFKGNPAGVYITDNLPSPERMQNIAMEMNLSETAFVMPRGNEFEIRYFTPVSEVDLCGHATLSASHILYETGIVSAGDAIKFHSKAGELSIIKRGKSIVMNFPVYSLRKIDIPSSFRQSTGLDALELYQSDYNWKLVLMRSEDEVIEASPNPDTLLNAGLGELIVTAVSSRHEFDFVVRCFVPNMGIAEDPVTGSAHCALVPFWNMKTGKKEFRSFQASRRSGILKVKLMDKRVEITGEAVTVFKAELLI